MPTTDRPAVNAGLLFLPFVADPAMILTGVA
jgi:hypothetical protein